jgi:tRNA modification GTPase
MNDTIAAISTPPGRSALAVVRLSGGDAVAIADRVFRPAGSENGDESGPRSLAHAPPRTLRFGHAVDATHRMIDEVLAVVLPEPRSYTGETMVEITCHGGSYSAPRILAALLAAGARAAKAGEFTERAFLNGRMDLAQAEAVADVIHAESELAHRLAAKQIAGALSRGLSDVAESLRDLLAEVEARVDFADDVEGALPPSIARGLAAADAALAVLLAGSDLGRRAREGVRLALVGRPNVGKSSLFNALLGEDRALVSAVPGTTRDMVSERLEIAGVPVRVMDTAGMREPDDPSSPAAAGIERMGIARTEREVAGADVVLWVLDASAPWSEEDRAVLALLGTQPRVVALNKSDLPQRLALPPDVARGAEAVAVSALTGGGLPALRARLAAAVAGDERAAGDDAEALVTNTRHIDALRRARIALADATAHSAPGEIIAGEIRLALEALGEVTGEAVAPDLLDRIFARFCIGK